MAEIVFIYDGRSMTIQCNINQKMKDICINLSKKINTGINSLTFLYGGRLLNLEKINKIKENDNENNIIIKNNLDSDGNKFRVESTKEEETKNENNINR